MILRRLPGLLFTLLLAASSQAAPPAGAFELVRGGQTATIQSWGPHCGPRPTNTTDRAGAIYTLTAAGTLKAERRRDPPLFQAGICTAATAQPRMKEQRGATTIRCASVDPARKISGTARLKASGLNELTVTQQFAYDWVLKGSHCQLTLAGRWRLRRQTPIERCAQPGPARTIQLNGPQRVRLGRTARFDAQALDANGCTASTPVTWSASAGRIDAGRLDTRGLSAGARVQVTATAGAASQSVTTRLVGGARRGPSQPTSEAQDLAAVHSGQLPAPTHDALPPQAGTAVDAASGAVADEPGLSPLLTALFGALVVLAIGLAGWIVVTALRLRRRAAAPDPLEAATQPPPTAAPERVAPTSAVPVPIADGPMQCPSCGRRFEDGSRFCPYDGSTLDDHHPADPPTAEPGGERVCPSCQARYPGSATHCGFDGSPLVPADTGQDTVVDLPRVRARVCPTCGTHYPLDTEFCGLDGTALILLN